MQLSFQPRTSCAFRGEEQQRQQASAACPLSVLSAAARRRRLHALGPCAAPVGPAPPASLPPTGAATAVRRGRAMRLCVSSRLVLTPTGSGSTKHLDEPASLPAAISLKEGLFEVGGGRACPPCLGPGLCGSRVQHSARRPAARAAAEPPALLHPSPAPVAQTRAQIGRAAPADIVVPIPTVSTRHAVVRVIDAASKDAGAVLVGAAGRRGSVRAAVGPLPPFSASHPAALLGHAGATPSTPQHAHPPTRR